VSPFRSFLIKSTSKVLPKKIAKAYSLNWSYNIKSGISISKAKGIITRVKLTTPRITGRHTLSIQPGWLHC